MMRLPRRHKAADNEVVSHMRILTVCPALAAAWALLVFAPAAQAAPAHIAPACASKHHREFDYFIGNYNVFDASGKQIGTDEVTAEMNGCALLERWHGRRVEGRGYSAYDDSRRQWVQTFFQNDGTVLIFRGNMTPQGILLSGTDYAKPGVLENNRVLFRPRSDGFEEYWTTSTDGGHTWRAVFDGFFRRR